jgi:hypothetical protein
MVRKHMVLPCLTISTSNNNILEGNTFQTFEMIRLTMMSKVIGAIYVSTQNILVQTYELKVDNHFHI